MHNKLKVLAIGCSLVVSAAIAAEPESRIIGGCDSKESSHSWMVGLKYSNSSTEFRGTFCGGTLIHENWVMTAAHCLYFQGSVLTASDIELLIGVTELDSGQGQQHAVAEIVVHTAYTAAGSAGYNDIALLKLASPSTATPARLATVKPGANYTALTAGWGRLVNTPTGVSTDDYPHALQEVNVQTYDNANCLPFPDLIAESQICAGYLSGGKDSCSGDSGGPLLLSSAGQDTLVGVVSYGYQCAQVNALGVYTSVPSYLNWVASTTYNAQTNASDVPLPTSYSENYDDFDSSCATGSSPPTTRSSGGALSPFWLALLAPVFCRRRRSSIHPT